MKTFYPFLFLLISSIGFSQSNENLNKQIRQTVEDIRRFCAIPNDANSHADINRNIYWLTDEFSKRGFNTAVLPTSGEDLFFATLPLQEGLKTLLLYMHFDGQAVDPKAWNQTDPYEVVLKSKDGEQWKEESFDQLDQDIQLDWRLFGRSVSDDKGPIVMLLNAIDLLQLEAKGLKYNLKVILDSEEEKSSAPLPAAVDQYKELLTADELLILDGPVHASGKPTLVYGCRGITTLTLTTYGPKNPQHSGHYGNYAPNPNDLMAQLLASFKDADGRVVVPGYYDGIHLDEFTQNVLKKVPDSEFSIRDYLKINEADKVGSFYQEALQYPSLNTRGMNSAWVGDNARTIVPNETTAEIDMRLVVESDGDRLKKLVKNHIANQGYFIVSENPTDEQRLQHSKIIKVEEGSVTQAFRTPLEDPFGVTLVNLLEQTFNEKPVQIRTMGGTVPIAAFVNKLKVPAFIVPLVNPDNNQHSPNENLKIAQIDYGLRLYYNLLKN